MTKFEELAIPDSCFNKAHDSELMFVILERDTAAPATIRKWIEERIALGLNEPGDAKLGDAERLAQRIESQRASRGVGGGGDE